MSKLVTPRDESVEKLKLLPPQKKNVHLSSLFLLSDIFHMNSFTSNTVLSCAHITPVSKNLSHRRHVCIYERLGSGARGETTLSWEFVDAVPKFRHDPAFLVSFDELGFDDAFTEIYCKEENSHALIMLERIVGARIYQRALNAKMKKRV